MKSIIQFEVCIHIFAEDAPQFWCTSQQLRGHIKPCNLITDSHDDLLLPCCTVDVATKRGPSSRVFQSTLPIEMVFT